MKVWFGMAAAAVTGAAVHAMCWKPVTSAETASVRSAPQTLPTPSADQRIQLAFFESEAPAPPQRLPSTTVTDELPGLPPADAAQLPEGASEAAVREVIDRALKDASAEERQIWFDELKGLPPGVVEELLNVRRQFGTPTSETLSTFVPHHQKPPSPPSNRADFRWSDTRAALLRARNVHLHNLANVQSVGYRRLVPVFQAAAAPTDDAGQPAGCRWVGVRPDLSAGPLIETGRPLDVAVQGPGWFAVRDADGKLSFTRAGHFTLNDSHELCIRFAAAVLRLEPVIQLPGDVQITIASDGGIFAMKAAGTREPLARIQLAAVRDPVQGNDGLLYTNDESAVQWIKPGSDGAGSLLPGMLEQSNVDSDAEWAAIERIDRWLKAAGE